MKRLFRKRSVADNALLVARSLGEKYHRSGRENQERYGLIPPVAPTYGHEYQDDVIQIIISDSVVGPNIHVKSSEPGHWVFVYSISSAKEVYRFNDGDWVDHLAELASDLRSKLRRAKQARHRPLV